MRRPQTLRVFRVVETPEALSKMAAEEVVTCAADAIRKRGRFAIALSGGSTPKQLFELLATPAFASRVAWPQVHVFWGDERCVPPEDPQSNYRMTSEALLDHVPIPETNVHRIRGEDAPEIAAALYETEIREFYNEIPAIADSIPALDLILLGLGTDGHTASLFPGGTAVHEHRRWVVSEYAASVGMWRVTLTLPLINASRRVLFLVAGEEKAEVVGKVTAFEKHHDVLPAELVAPTKDVVYWIGDAAAMSKCTAMP